MTRRSHNLRTRREALGFSQSEIAEACGFLYPSYVSGAEAIDNGTKPSWKDPGAARRIPKIRAVLVALENKPRRKREGCLAEAARIAFQRSLWKALPDHPAKRALKASMLDRCLELMHQGDGKECDAIAEFLPDDEVQRMFDRWEIETMADHKCWHCKPTAAFDAARAAPRGGVAPSQESGGRTNG